MGFRCGRVPDRGGDRVKTARYQQISTTSWSRIEGSRGLMFEHQVSPRPNHRKGWLMADTTPTPTSLYKYYDRDGVLLYIGITGRGMTRNSEHNKTKPWWKFVASQKVEHFSTRKEAAIRERHLIRKMAPPFNKQMNPEFKTANESYFVRKGLGGDKGVREFINGKNRVAAVVANIVGDRVTLACPDTRVSFEDRSSIRVESGGRHAKLIDVGTFADQRGSWARIQTPLANRVLGAVVMYRNLNVIFWPVKVIQVVYNLDEAQF